MKTIQEVKKPPPKKTVELDGVRLSGIQFNNPDNVVGVVIPNAERSKIRNENADYHRLGGKLLAVTETRLLADSSIMFLGRFTESPAPYFASEEWGL
jgi:hypothetical protein